MPSTIASAKCSESWTTSQKKPQARLGTIPSRLRRRAPKPRRNSPRRPRRRCLTRQATFLAAYRKTSSIAAAAKAAGIKPAQHWWLGASAAYWEAFRQLQEDVIGRLQDKVVERAMDGWAEPVFYRGRVCGTTSTIPIASSSSIWREKSRSGDRFAAREV